MSIKVLLADDLSVVLDGLRYVIEDKSEDIMIIGEASNGKDVLEFAEKNLVDVYILGISMQILNGIETTYSLMKMNP